MFRVSVMRQRAALAAGLLLFSAAALGDSTTSAQALRIVQQYRDRVGQMGRWSDQNGTNTFYPAAARVGLTGTDITLSTSTNEVIHVAPNGTTYDAILSLMANPGPAGWDDSLQGRQPRGSAETLP